jgi:hypothetical protein
MKILQTYYICHMEKKQLPVGRQSFRSLREDNCIYVDKTQQIYNICNEGKMYFLSRPRRFGKSLLLSTMKEIFMGSKALFQDLWIADKWDWTKKNPIIYISFLNVPYATMGLDAGLRYFLLEQFEEQGIDSKGITDISLLFTRLIKELYQREGKVVILIDEYDKAIIDYLEHSKIEQAKANQEILGLFYGVLKEADDYIRLLFITGISKFTKVSLFSKLNNLNDITLNLNYATMLGYTQTELEHYFVDYIDDTLDFMQPMTREELLVDIRLWYNGYSWDGRNTVYNPFGTLLFFSNKDFQSFWFQSGTPSFLVKKMLEQTYFHLENTETTINFLDQYSLDNIELTSLLFQTGYLTIKEKSRGNLVLSYPNQEVKDAMYTFLIDGMGHTVGGGGVTVQHLNKAFLKNDLERAETILTALFGGLTYDVYMHQTQKQVEGFYHGLIHILFKCLGIYMQSEVHTAKGRADSIVETPTHVYLLEFKINSDAETAFNQIINRKYATSYAADNRVKVGVGINFNSATKEMDAWKVENL